MEYYHLGSDTESDGSTSSFSLGVADSGKWHIVVNNSKHPRIHRLSEEEVLARSVGGIPLIQLVRQHSSRLFEAPRDARPKRHHDGDPLPPP
jgi:hypothetical protein